MAIVRIPSLDLGASSLPEDPLVVVVEGIEKPGNIGAILRSADGAAVDAVIAASPRTDPFNPNAIRASPGPSSRCPLAAASDRGRARRGCASGVRIVAARVDGAERVHRRRPDRAASPWSSAARRTDLGDGWSAGDVVAVRVPMLGVADSLNVSVAAAVLLYEARRQRGEPVGTTRG